MDGYSQWLTRVGLPKALEPTRTRAFPVCSTDEGDAGIFKAQ